MIEAGIESVQVVGEFLCIFGINTLPGRFASDHRLQFFPKLFLIVRFQDVFILVSELHLVLGYLSSNLSSQILRLLHVSRHERLLSLN